jgi:hypothetical protein
MRAPSRVEIILAIAIVIGTFCAHQYAASMKQAEIAEFYKIIDTQEALRDDVPVTEGDLAAIVGCQKIPDLNLNGIENCRRAFYDAYTMKHGGVVAFAHLARLQRDHPDLLPSCHYISHGIGHAVLRLNNNNPFAAFSFMQESGVFKNIATCGNGFFHGVIEEVAKNTTDKDALVDLLQPICSDPKIDSIGNCYHGVGHAAMIQTDYNLPDVLYICDRISTRPESIFSCHTGGFMEYAQVFTDVVNVENQRMNFILCDALEKKYQAPCYLEQSSYFEQYSNDRRNYTRNIGFCRQIQDTLNRMACVKLFAIRAVRLVHYNEIYDMCQNTSTMAERVMCTAVIADRIASSVDRTRQTDQYRNMADAVCGTLNFVYAPQCKKLVYKERGRLFYTSDLDLRLSPVADWIARIDSI